MNSEALHTLEQLRHTFKKPSTGGFFTSQRGVSIGLEIECSWRSYFPDLWVDGFPNIDPDQLAAIGAECSRREDTLIADLLKTVDCGVTQGRDRYWEFAFQPVTDVSIVCNQIAVLQSVQLIPPGNHSLHITIGGLKVDRNAHFIAFLIEMLLASPERILSAFNIKNPSLSTGWARKGYAGVFEKDGKELMHGATTAIEFRVCSFTDTVALFDALCVVQQFADELLIVQNEGTSARLEGLATFAQTVLTKHGLPNKNWKKPNMEPEIWNKFANSYPEILTEFNSNYGVEQLRATAP